MRLIEAINILGPFGQISMSFLRPKLGPNRVKMGKPSNQYIYFDLIPEPRTQYIYFSAFFIRGCFLLMENLLLPSEVLDCNQISVLVAVFLFFLVVVEEVRGLERLIQRR